MKLKKTLFVALGLYLCGGRRPCPAQRWASPSKPWAGRLLGIPGSATPSS